MAVPAADVTTQVAPFRLRGAMSAGCFLDAAIDALGNLGLSSTVVNASVDLLTQTLTSVNVRVDVNGDLSIERHGQNGAVHHVAWNASLMQASMVLMATTVKASATACIASTSAVEVPTVGGTSTAQAMVGAFAQVGVRSRTRSNQLATATNLGSVEAANITEVTNLISFTVENFVFAEQSTEFELLVDVLTRAAALNNSASTAVSIRAAAQAVATVMASVRVESVIEGHYKAMPGRASQTDLLEPSNVSATVIFETSTTVETVTLLDVKVKVE
jgi:hypothetical protein